MMCAAALSTLALPAQAQANSSLFVTVDSANTMSLGAAMVPTGQALEQHPRGGCCCVALDLMLLSKVISLNSTIAINII